MLRAAAVVEKLGIPTASIIGSGFLKQAEVVMKGLGVPLAIGVYPGAPRLAIGVDGYTMTSYRGTATAGSDVWMFEPRLPT